MATSFQFGSLGFRVTGKGPHILHFNNGFLIAINDRVILVQRGRDKLANDANSDVGFITFHLGANNFGLIDTDEG